MDDRVEGNGNKDRNDGQSCKEVSTVFQVQEVKVSIRVTEFKGVVFNLVPEVTKQLSPARRLLVEEVICFSLFSSFVLVIFFGHHGVSEVRNVHSLTPFYDTHLCVRVDHGGNHTHISKH